MFNLHKPGLPDISYPDYVLNVHQPVSNPDIITTGDSRRQP